MTRIQLTLLALSLGLSGGCGSYTAPTNQNPPPPPVQGNDVSIVVGASLLATAAFSPNPKEVSLSGGSSVPVRWVNKDISGDYTSGTATLHNITSDTDPPAFTASGTLGGNQTYSVTLTAGDYHYHCSIHPTMVGTITVSP